MKSTDLADLPGQRTFHEFFHFPVDLPDLLIRWPVSQDCLFFRQNEIASSFCSMLGSELDRHCEVGWAGFKAEKV